MSVSFGQIVSEKRKASGYTKKALGNSIGCSTPTICSIESNRYDGHWITRLKIAKALGISLDDFIKNLEIKAPTTIDGRKFKKRRLRVDVDDEGTIEGLKFVEGV